MSNLNLTKHELWIVALSESSSNKGFYALILEDSISKRRIPLIIGATEAQSIALAIEKMQIVRPQTHDLFYQTLLLLNAPVKEVFIHTFENEVFFSSILIEKEGQLVEIDARPSDAIALAVRFDCPIFTTFDVIEHSAYYFDEKARDKKGSYAEYTLEELEELLRRIILKEDYESAVRVREAIAKRKGNLT